MKQHIIMIGLMSQPYLIANTCLDTNKSMKFKDGKDCDEVRNRIKIPTKEQTYLAFRVIENVSSSRSGNKDILVDIQGNEITTIKIGTQTEITISIDLSDHKTPITLKYADFNQTLEQKDGKITLKISVDKLDNSDKIRIEGRNGGKIIEIKTSK